MEKVAESLFKEKMAANFLNPGGDLDIPGPKAHRSPNSTERHPRAPRAPRAHGAAPRPGVFLFPLLCFPFSPYPSLSPGPLGGTSPQGGGGRAGLTLTSPNLAVLWRQGTPSPPRHQPLPLEERGRRPLDWDSLSAPRSPAMWPKPAPSGRVPLSSNSVCSSSSSTPH